MKKLLLLLTCLCFLLIACGQHVRFSAVQGPANLTLQRQSLGTTPVEKKLKTTTFGRYRYIVEKEGYNTLEGVLPLKVSARNIVLDALFFAPAVFFNAQYPFKEYEFDLEKGIIRFRNRGNWREKPAEFVKAKENK